MVKVIVHKITGEVVDFEVKGNYRWAGSKDARIYEVITDADTLHLSMQNFLAVRLVWEEGGKRHVG